MSGKVVRIEDWRTPREPVDIGAARDRVAQLARHLRANGATSPQLCWAIMAASGRRERADEWFGEGAPEDAA